MHIFNPSHGLRAVRFTTVFPLGVLSFDFQYSVNLRLVGLPPVGGWQWRLWCFETNDEKRLMSSGLKLARFDFLLFDEKVQSPDRFSLSCR
jgi:hypothetical protein